MRHTGPDMDSLCVDVSNTLKVVLNQWGNSTGEREPFTEQLNMDPHLFLFIRINCGWVQNGTLKKKWTIELMGGSMHSLI